LIHSSSEKVGFTGTARWCANCPDVNRQAGIFTRLRSDSGESTGEMRKAAGGEEVKKRD